MSLLDTASLIVTPNGVKEGKLYSVIPSDGSGDMSVVRATTATRVNSAGLVELVPYNYNTYSENFITSWGNDGTSTVTNNFTTAPNGMMTAAKLVSNVANGYGYKFNTVPNGTFTLSYYIKASANTTISIAFNDIGGNGYIASYNIPVTTEWQRISLTANLVGTSLLIDYSQLQLGVEYYIWGCQINEGAIKDYQKTETRLNIPRLDYSNGTCPSLLVEPQRTNLISYSEDISNAIWNAINCTVTSNNVVSPSGIQNADTAVTTANNSFLGRTVSISSDGSTYTQSIFAKWVSGYELFKFRTSLTGGTAVAKESVFNLKTGAYISGDTTYNIQDYGNGWFRFSHQITNNSTNTTYNYQIYNTNDSTQTQSASFLGAQAELGSYSTSYIPTTSASVTRNADVISKTGISSLIGQTEGTLFVDYNYEAKPDVNGNILMVIYNGTNEAYIFITGAGTLLCELYVSGVQQAAIAGSIGSIGRKKIAFAYKQNSFAVYLNGNLIGTDSTGNVGSMSTIFIGGYYISNYNANGGINASALWQTRLTNTQLAALTSL